MSDNNDLIPITGLWVNEGNSGKYMSGTLGSAKVLIFPNRFREKDNQPTHVMYLAPRTKKKGGEKSDHPAAQDIPF